MKVNGRNVLRVALAVLALASASCAGEGFTPAPNIPAAYYDCLEATPAGLVAVYTVHYFDIYSSQVLYDNKVFVFKNIEATKAIVSHVGEGYAWLGDIKCLLADEALSRYKPGEKFDLVGINLGIRRDQEVPFCLLFKDCVVIPAGSLKLPAEGSAVVVPGY